MKRAQRAEIVIELLADEYPDAVCELDYSTPWQLLVATVMSAQCTDARVNMVTPELFRRWPAPGDAAAAELSELEDVIRPTGFFRNKAKSIRDSARMIVADHGGDVPPDLDELVRLPGVGRKTAKVVLGEAFGIPAGVAVDTHVRRVTTRLGLTARTDPEKIATDLEKLVPRDDWVTFSLRLILHGRRVCKARKPVCDGCALSEVCRKLGV
jgi:endonuclease-3